MPGLTGREHRAALAESRRLRNGRARERRVVEVLDVVGPDGQRLLVACSRSWPGHGYLLVPDGAGGYRCACPSGQIRGACAHIKAAQSREAQPGAAGPGA